jgi:hypothetical protein
MKLAGFLLLPAGWVIAVTAVALFSHPVLRWVFVLAGLCLQLGSLMLIFLAMHGQPERPR